MTDVAEPGEGSAGGCVLLPAPWREPLDVLGPIADEPFALGLLSDGSEEGRWSYVARAPVRIFNSLDELQGLTAGLAPHADQPDLPPFRGGAAGLASYEWGATLEASSPQARTGWPDLIGGVYHSLLAFDHKLKRVWAVGRGGSRPMATRQAETALALLHAPARPLHPWKPASFVASKGPASHRTAVAQVVAAICRGEIFQANIARVWKGRLASGAEPFDLLARLVRQSPAPFAGYLRLPGRAIVSDSPERFVQVSPSGRALCQPIKGTRPRGHTPTEDRALAKALLASAKDRAENLMIVDLMRNDLARVCQSGSVKVEAFCALESFTNVHHLVSTITGQLQPGRTAVDLLAAAFPPGSITGAPKLQAMTVIARHETARGPYCGSLFWAGSDGAFDSSVLIRTVALEEDAKGWRFETRAGGGVTADSDPGEEDAEAITKIAAIRAAMSRG
jgi:para-aminobenzoate synthetase component 1